MRKMNIMNYLKKGILFSLLGVSSFAIAQIGGACNLVIDVDFNNRQANELYTIAKADQDFGKIRAMTSGEIRGLTSAFPHRTRTENGTLKAEYLKNDASGRAGGFLFDQEFAPTDEAVLEYKVKFDKDFVWATGGKLPGLGGTSQTNNGAIPSGCRYNTNGWSARLMWRRNRAQTNDPYLILYSYFAEKQDGGKRVDGDCGDGKRIFSNLKTDTWYTIRQYIKMNTPGQDNGTVVMWINGVETYRDNKANIRNSGKDNLKINALIMNTYRGGSRTDPVWHSPTTDHAFFDDFKVWTNCSDPGNVNPPVNKKPTASWTFPTSNSTIQEGETMNVDVNATDSDGDIASVDLFLNNSFIRTEKVAPYLWGTNVSDGALQNMSAGTYTLKAVVTDDDGAKTEITRTFMVQGSLPKDCAGVSGGSASVDACGVCSGGTTGITPSSPRTWYADTDSDGKGDANNTVQDCNKPSGYVAVSGDQCPNDGNKTAPGECGCGVVEGTCANQNPIASITSPNDGQEFILGTTITFGANASDADGSIDKVNFKINGKYYSQDRTSPYTGSFTPTEVGTYTIGARAFDNDGASVEPFVTITVMNAQPNDCAGVAGGSASVDACGVCSGGTTGITPSSPKTWYADADGDGSGDASNSVEACNKPSGYVAVAGDQCPSDGNKTNSGECGCGVVEGTCNNNNAPTLSFTKPVNGDEFDEGVTLVGNVIASDADGSISNVVLYVNGTLVRQENFSPYDWNHKDQDAALQNMSAGTYVLRAVATDNEGLSSEKSITITVKEEVVVTSEAIIGDDCAMKNGVANFEVNSELRKNATSYSWWFSGSSSSVISPNAAPYTAEITMSQYYKGGEVCVGVNSNAAPYYKSYCKSVGVCSDQEVLETTEVLMNEYPNPVDGNSITIEINEQSGEILEVSILSSTGDTQMSTTEFVSGGQLDLTSLPSGSHVLRVVTEYGVVNKRILKL